MARDRQPFFADVGGGELEALPLRPLTPDGSVVCRVVDPRTVESAACGARRRGRHRLGTFASRARYLGQVAEAWLAPGSPWLAEAVERLHAVEGWAPRMLRTALRHMFRGLTEAALLELKRRELGPECEPPGRPGLVVVWASGNLPVAVLPHVVYALALGNAVLVRISAREPILLRLFCDSLAATQPVLSVCCRLLYWPADDRACRQAAFSQARAILAFGRDETLAELTLDVPEGVRFLPYGSRASLTAIGRERLRRAALPHLATRAARDLALFDQQGCHSPQAIYVEEGGEAAPAEFAAALAEALAAWQVRWPRRPLTPAEHAAIHQWRAAWEMRSLTDPRGRLWTSPRGTDWSVILDPNPTFAAPGLPRQTVIKPLPDLACLPAALHGWEERLETVALAAATDRRPALTAALARVGVRRVCAVGRAQEPDMLAPHDGRPRLAVLLDENP